MSRAGGARHATPQSTDGSERGLVTVIDMAVKPEQRGAEVDSDMAVKLEQRVKFLVKIVSKLDVNHPKRYEGLKLSGLKS